MPALRSSSCNGLLGADFSNTQTMFQPSSTSHVSRSISERFASELATLVQERCFYHLEAPVGRVTGWDTPYPHAYEWTYFPGPKRLKTALEKVMAD